MKEILEATEELRAAGIELTDKGEGPVLVVNGKEAVYVMENGFEPVDEVEEWNPFGDEGSEQTLDLAIYFLDLGCRVASTANTEIVDADRGLVARGSFLVVDNRTPRHADRFSRFVASAEIPSPALVIGFADDGRRIWGVLDGAKLVLR